MVRDPPEPPRTRLAGGTRPGLEEATLTKSEAGAVSRSPMANVSGPVAPSSSIVRFGIVEMVGASLLLCSDAASYIAGVELMVTGGAHLTAI